MTSDSGSQTDSAGLTYALGEEQARVEEANERRAARRGYLVFAIDPALGPDQPGYRDVFATEAGTPNEATAKIRPACLGAPAANPSCNQALPRRARRSPLGCLEPATVRADDRTPWRSIGWTRRAACSDSGLQARSGVKLETDFRGQFRVQMLSAFDLERGREGVGLRW